MGFELVKSSVVKIFHPQSMECSVVTIIILLASILIKIYMYLYNRSIGQKIESVVMTATATDSLSDSIATSVVLVSTFIYLLTNINIDAYCGVLVGLFILYSGFNAAKETISPLLGQPPKPELIEQIKNIVFSHKEILGIHDMMVHDYGPGRIIASLHAEVDSRGDIMNLHEVIDCIETEIRDKCLCQAVIHMDPVLVNDPYTDELKEKVQKIIHDFDPNLNFHDFRVVKGQNRTNIIFDLLLPFKYKFSDEYMVKYLKDEVKKINPTFFAVINVDKGSL